MAVRQSSEDVRPIPGYPGYFAGRNGCIYSSLTQGGPGVGWYAGTSRKRLKPGRCGEGYLGVNIRGNGNGRSKKYVHRLVCLTFHGEPKPGQEVCHQDGVRSHNSADNLRWDTRSNNHADKVKHGTAGLGEKRYNAKLTKELIISIIDRRSAGFSAREIADADKIHVSTVNNVLNGHTWSHVTGINRHSGVISRSQAKKIVLKLTNI